jgi:hypothetical protein
MVDELNRKLIECQEEVLHLRSLKNKFQQENPNFQELVNATLEKEHHILQENSGH